ncbi:hypothetical protein DEA8626_03198 [Defluviimonas aquaemixtae]|uniref:Uncharacterized protein n=1 Tax=Albidovulum aquaemixtae TaxID=1542388 RepID=A0A2R8BL92_9RHOB|nr:hypothetical protein [Defluviimonas aquaemixtae]SPH24149.1 hypothetical protein DEA8626_03198 [Defluviimonas aquaemixtae]
MKEIYLIQLEARYNEAIRKSRANEHNPDIGRLRQATSRSIFAMLFATLKDASSALWRRIA